MEGIRVCASSPPFILVMTWYWNGQVWLLDRQTGEELLMLILYTLDEFNELLYEWEIQPVGMGRKGKREEKQEQQQRYTLTF